MSSAEESNRIFYTIILSSLWYQLVEGLKIIPFIFTEYVRSGPLYFPRRITFVLNGKILRVTFEQLLHTVWFLFILNSNDCVFDLAMARWNDMISKLELINEDVIFAVSWSLWATISILYFNSFELNISAFDIYFESIQDKYFSIMYSYILNNLET